MRDGFRTLKRTVSALVIVLTLIAGAGIEAFAHGKRGKRHRHDQGRHIGWERGRRMSVERRGREWNRRDRRDARRHRRGDRFERRDLSRHQKAERRELKAHQRAERSALKSHQRSERRAVRRDRRF